MKIMSQMRVGDSDFGRQENNVMKMLKCMKKYTQESVYVPCSDWTKKYDLENDTNSSNSTNDTSGGDDNLEDQSINLEELFFYP